MNPLSRRRFLGISAATLAAAGLAPALTGRGMAKASPPPSPDAGALETIPTFCDVCFWKCGAIATVRDGQLWKIEGNPADPLCRGRLCPRGTGGCAAYDVDDRLQRPLRRANVRGEDTWNVVSWDEARGYTAERMQAIAQK